MDQSRNVDGIEDVDANQSSSAPRTLDRMIGSKAPQYSPLTVSQQNNGMTDGGDNVTQGRNTLSVSMSDNSSSAFIAHSPPYMRRRHNNEKLSSNQNTTENLDMKDIYEPVGRKSVENFPANDYRAARNVDNQLLQSQVGNLLSADSSSQLQISQDSMLRLSQQQRMMMQQLKDINAINRVQEELDDDDDDDDDSFSAPMIDASYLRAESQNNMHFSQSGPSQFQNEPVNKELSPESQGFQQNRPQQPQQQQHKVSPPSQQQSAPTLTKNQKRMMTYDGFIGGDCDDSYNDLSGEIISIEDTYKEVSQYRKSGGSKDSMRVSGVNSGSGAIGVGSNVNNTGGSFATVGNIHGAHFEELKQSQQMSDGMRRSMTVIQEEDFEDSAQATSYLNFNSYIGGNNFTMQQSTTPRSGVKFAGQQQQQQQQQMLQQSNQSLDKTDHIVSINAAKGGQAHASSFLVSSQDYRQTGERLDQSGKLLHSQIPKATKNGIELNQSAFQPSSPHYFVTGEHTLKQSTNSGEQNIQRASANLSNSSMMMQAAPEAQKTAEAIYLFQQQQHSSVRFRQSADSNEDRKSSRNFPPGIGSPKDQHQHQQQHNRSNSFKRRSSGSGYQNSNTNGYAAGAGAGSSQMLQRSGITEPTLSPTRVMTQQHILQQQDQKRLGSSKERGSHRGLRSSMRSSGSFTKSPPRSSSAKRNASKGKKQKPSDAYNQKQQSPAFDVRSSGRSGALRNAPHQPYEKPFSIQEMLNKHQQRYSEQYRDALASSQMSSNASPYRNPELSPSTVHFRQSWNNTHNGQAALADLAPAHQNNLHISQSTANMLQQMSQSSNTHSRSPQRPRSRQSANKSSNNQSQEFANRKMQVKAQKQQFKQSMEMLKRQPLNTSGKRSASGSQERVEYNQSQHIRKNSLPRHHQSTESDLAASKFIDRTMGLSPPRSTTLMLQSPDHSKILGGAMPVNTGSQISNNIPLQDQLQIQFPALMQVALGQSTVSATAVETQPAQYNQAEPMISHRSQNNNRSGVGAMTSAKQSLLSIDDLTLSQTDGTALKNHKSNQLQSQQHQLSSQEQPMMSTNRFLNQVAAGHQQYSSYGQLLQGSLLTNEPLTATATSKEHLEEVKRVFQMMQQMQQECKIAETQRDRAINELFEVRDQYAEEKRAAEEVWQARLKAKECETEELRNCLADNKVIADVKLQDARQRLNNAEMSVFKRVEQDYANTLEKKEQQLKLHDQARQEAQTKLLQLESDWKLEKRQLVIDYEAKLSYERDQCAEEIGTLRSQVQQASAHEQRKMREIVAQEYEFKANQREGLLREQIKQLEKQIELEREVIEQTKDRELQDRIREERVRLEEQQVVDNVQTTHDIYAEMERALRTKFAQEERQRVNKLKKEMTAELKCELAKKESSYEALLAKERQQVSKVNLKVAQMEISIEALEEQVNLEKTQKEKLQQQHNELDLKPVRGSGGHCLRCEALMISNGQAIQKIKKLKKEYQTLQRKAQGDYR